MQFTIRKSYFKIRNVDKEQRIELKFCRVKTVVQLAQIDLEEELAEGTKSHDRFLLFCF